MLSLAYEPGRMAFSGRATTFAELHHDGVEHVALKARAEHYAPASRAALHHLERELFELPVADRLFEPEPVDPGEAVTLLQGGGERAELELVGAEIARLIAEEGFAPEEIAVVLRDPAPAAALLTEVFTALGVAVAIDRRVAFGHTALGRGLVALVRCALLDGSADDLLAWLRTPGLLRRPELADGLEVAARQAGARTATQARALWEADHWKLDAIDRVRDAHRRGPETLLERLSEELATLFAAPRRRAAEVLTGPAAQDGEVLLAGRRALDELAAIVAADRALAPSPAQLAALLEELEVRGGARPAAGCVTVTEPLALRARRVRALFACGLQEGVFPALPGAEPFFGDAERERIAAASGLRLRRRDDLGAERYLFYATVSRPEERLYLSWHEAGDDGEQAVPSFFLSDVCDLFGPQLSDRRRMRTLGEVGWPGGAPTARERLREAVIAGPRHREAPIAALADAGLVGELRARSTWSASGIELWASCPVKWFVERCLTPEGLTPDPELMLRGQLAHLALEATLRDLHARTGSARLHEGTLPLARERAVEALDRLGSELRLQMSPDPRRQRALAHRLRADLLRYLDYAAEHGSELEPTQFEVAFGDGPDGLPALELPGGVRIGGRIDRVDESPAGEAIVYDYKGRNAPDAGELAREAQVPDRALHPGRPRRARTRARRRPVPAARRARPAPARARARGRDGGASRPCRPTGARPRTSTRSSTASSRTSWPPSPSCAPARSRRGRTAARGTTRAARIPRSAGAAPHEHPARIRRAPVHGRAVGRDPRARRVAAARGQRGQRQDVRARRALRALRARGRRAAAADPGDHVHRARRGRAARPRPRPVRRAGRA